MRMKNNRIWRISIGSQVGTKPENGGWEEKKKFNILRGQEQILGKKSEQNKFFLAS